VDLARSVEQAYRDVGELGKIVPDLPDTPYNNRSDAH
jgi:hypothetical protein